MLCQNCRTQNVDNSDFCMNCGALLNKDGLMNVTKSINEVPSNQQPGFNNNVKNAQPKKGKIAILTVIGIIIIILVIGLASTKVDKKVDNLKKVCKTSNCVNFTIYFLEGSEQSNLKEKYETYAIEKGTVLNAKIILDTVNKMFKSEFLSSDGKSFYMTVGGFAIEFGWYYKDTDIKFDWSQPIEEDTEIEMKLFKGLFDKDTFINIDNWFRK